MGNLKYKTVSANSKTVTKNWVLVDAEDKVLGRLTSEIAKVLRGKNKPCYTPHVDCGDRVIVINAEKVRFTGNKLNKKEYISYTGYPGGQRFTTPKQLLAKFPNRVIEYAIKGMLPKTKLGAEIFRSLHVYTGKTHPHEAQKPKTLEF